MRAHILALSLIAATTATGAFAQQATPPLPTFLDTKGIAALVDKAKADRKNDAPLVSEPILGIAPYRAMLEYRSATAPAAVHETDVELMIVLEGTGNIVTGGKVVDEKRVNDHNLSGPSIADGKSQAVAKGDMIIVPSHTPHQVIPTGGAPIILMTLHAPAAPANWP